MDETKNDITEPVEDTKPSAKEEAIFTQADVDRIVEKRLARYKASVADSKKDRAEEADGREAALTARENKVACYEYIIEKGYPTDLLDMIGSEDPDSFRAKADKFVELVRSQTPAYPSVKDQGEVSKVSNTDNFSAAFSKANVHVPQKPKDYRW